MLERDVIKYAKKSLKGKWERLTPDYPGRPDYLYISPCGQATYVEFKRADGKLSAAQVVAIAALTKLGYQAVVIYGKEGVDDFTTVSARCCQLCSSK